jgi:ElaB/YqjD/DUF883 family membrane-anchored ribosome-binding protein
MGEKTQKEKVKEYHDRLVQKVRDHPQESVGIAFGVGVVVGALVVAAAVKRCH